MTPKNEDGPGQATGAVKRAAEGTATHHQDSTRLRRLTRILQDAIVVYNAAELAEVREMHPTATVLHVDEFRRLQAERDQSFGAARQRIEARPARAAVAEPTAVLVGAPPPARTRARPRSRAARRRRAVRDDASDGEPPAGRSEVRP
jgi:hypothetical protein